MKLTKEQCVQLDQVLNAFGQNDNIDRKTVLEIFNQDEKLAYSLVHVLVSNGLVSEVGNVIDHDLPLMIFKERPASIFIANGGFEAEYDKAAAKILSDTSFQELQKKNIELQNENFAYLQTIREQEARLRSFDEQNKFVELLKSYWWIIVTAVGIGGVIAKFLLK